MTTTEERVAALEAVIPQINQRLATLEADMRELRQELHGLRQDFQALQWRITAIVSGMALAVVATIVGGVVSGAI